MDIKQITTNEYNNDGSYIHLYRNDAIGFWCAYGISAYGLRLFNKSHGNNNLRGYSPELDLPCSIISSDTLVILKQNAIEILELSECRLSLKMSDTINSESYTKWVKKLKTGANNDDDIIVVTPISQYVSKESFIKDGMSSFSRNTKRITDLLLSSVALVVFSPLICACWVAVKHEDGGPAIFKQERIGRFGRPFNIYKFRSMRIDAEKMGPQLSHSGGDNDPRLTKVGSFIRRHHLDELPQLWNVFCGDMAFIGPRPERKFYIDQILEHDQRYTYLYQIRPGVTSYATLYNGYTDTMEKMLKRLEYDLYYLGHRSWFFDIKILFNTFCSIVFGKKF